MSCTVAPLRVAFLHPELGLGGAERLVVDAASELVRLGHQVVLYTAALDRARSFAETRDGSLDIRVCGALLPAHVGQRLRAPASVLRMAWLGDALARGGPAVDVVVCDLVPHVIPWMRRRIGVPVVYYGHYPDLLLTPPRRGWYRLYRRPLDRLEAASLRRADLILTNSRFTADAFRRSLPTLRHDALEVLHPGVPVARDAVSRDPEAETSLLLCVGRIVPEKNYELAIASLGALRGRIAEDLYAKVRLVIAGGRDARLRESDATLRRLLSLARQHGVESQVKIRTSIADAERLDLLARCRCVVHPHPGEHFGIVPVEAMAAGRPVVAVDRGGPLETVVDGETGYLRPPQPAAFAEALARILTNPEEASRMGRAGRQRVKALFSLEIMGARLESLLRRVVDCRARKAAA